MIEIALEKIDIKPLGTHLLIDVVIDEVPYRLVLDTGASRTVIHSGLFKEGLIAEEELSIGVGSNQLESYQVAIDSLQIGSLEIIQIQVAALDLKHVLESYDKLNISSVIGVLGGDILEKYQAVIDYKSLTLKLNVNVE